MPRKSYNQHLAEKAAVKDLLHRRNGSLVESETDAESLFSSTTYQSQSQNSSSSPYLSLSPDNSNSSFHHQHHSYPTTRRTISSTSYTSSSLSNSNSFNRSFNVKNRDRSISPSRSSKNRYQGVNATEEPTFSSLPPEQDVHSDFNSDNQSTNRHKYDQDTARPFNKKRSQLTVPTNPTKTRRKTDKESYERILRREKREAKKQHKSTLYSNSFDSPLRKVIRYLNKIGLHDYLLPISLVFAFLIKVSLLLLLEPNPSQDTYKARYDIRRIGWRRIVEEIMWITVVRDWTQKECEKGGRSTRSHVIAILTILLSPISLFSKRFVLPMSMTLRPIALLSSNQNMTSVFYLALSLTISHSHWIWAVSIGLYVLGRGLWIGGSKGSTYLVLSSLVGVAALTSREVMCYSKVDSVQMNAYCQATFSLPSMLSLFNSLKSSKIRVAIASLSMIPPISILLYSNISLRPGNVDRPSPTLSLLTLMLFIISIPVYLFTADGHNVILPLMPITLLMSLRGSASKGGDLGGGVEDETWRLGVGLNALSLISLMHDEANAKEIALFVLMTALWITAIGASPFITLLVVIRQTCIMAIPNGMMFNYIIPTETIVVKCIFAAAWFWGMKKLIESAWAIGGLSGSSKRNGRKDGKEGKEKLI
ncbi:uncharacterized protein L201_001141 [Kwoniella dendrophila CBS 6074]|uniref:Uncharacterized protein n=1 Tax=Kwoniella dendrophila CBS 6074 TaxID=1295534 RepID=A0AAX4JMY7_9TREE